MDGGGPAGWKHTLEPEDRAEETSTEARLGGSQGAANSLESDSVNLWIKLAINIPAS